MLTIDDLNFPPTDATPVNLILPRDLMLRDRQIILKGREITLWHDGIHAYIKVGETTYAY